MLEEYDTNNDGVVEWGEFVGMMIKTKSHKGNAYEKMTNITMNEDGTTEAKVESKTGAFSTYSPAKVAAFSKLINFILKNDEDLKNYLPIKCDGDSLFHAFDNGVVLCKIVNTIDPESIDLRVIKNE